MKSNIWCNYKYLAKLPILGSKQFIDCDWRVVLLSKHPLFKNEYRCDDKCLRKFKAVNLHNHVRGLFVTCSVKNSNEDSQRYRVLFFDHLVHNEKLLPLIVHEVSHLVDNTLLFASVDVIDTELRAYLNDYYCRQIFNMLKISYDV